jgi:hypothetical protein
MWRTPWRIFTALLKRLLSRISERSGNPMSHPSIRCLGVILCALSVPTAVLHDASADEERLVFDCRLSNSGIWVGLAGELTELLAHLSGDPRVCNLLRVGDPRRTVLPPAESGFQRANSTGSTVTGALP